MNELDFKRRLCGTEVFTKKDSMWEILNTPLLTNGGSYYPDKTTDFLFVKSIMMLPTDEYSVLILKPDGNVIIYTEDDEILAAGLTEDY